MGMIDVTEDFQHAVEEACRQHGISAGTVTGFTTGGVAGLTTLEFEPGIVNHDLKAALDVFSPIWMRRGGWCLTGIMRPGMTTMAPPTSRRRCCPLHHGAFCERQNHCRALAEPDPHRVRHPGPGAGHCVPSDGRVSAAWVPSVRHLSVPAEPGPWRGRALPARTSEMQGPRPRQAAGDATPGPDAGHCVPSNGRASSSALTKDHSMTKETRPGMGAFLHTAVEKRRK